MKLKRLIQILSIVLTMAIFPSCLVTTHVVGEGGTYDGKKIKEYDLKRKKLYLFGAVPLDDVQPNDLAGGA